MRRNLVVGVVVACAIAAGAHWWLDGGRHPQRLLVDAGLLLTLAIFTLMATAPLADKVQQLVEAMRDLSLGHKDRRVDPAEFGVLGEIARAMNEVAASLGEGEDPNLGPVQTRPRVPHTYQPRAEEDSPDLGPVRVRKKDGGVSAPTPAAQPQSPAAQPPAPAALPAPPAPPVVATPEPQPQPQPHTPGPSLTPETPQAAAEPAAPRAPPSSTAKPTPPGGTAAPAEKSTPPEPPRIVEPTSIPPAPAANDTIIEAAPPQSMSSEAPSVPTRADLSKLFGEFVAAKKAHGEGAADLDFDSFAEMIAGECDRLIGVHHCKGVRFEVTMQDGEVSLRPRLLR